MRTLAKIGAQLALLVGLAPVQADEIPARPGQSLAPAAASSASRAVTLGRPEPLARPDDQCDNLPVLNAVIQVSPHKTSLLVRGQSPEAPPPPPPPSLFGAAAAAPPPASARVEARYPGDSGDTGFWGRMRGNIHNFTGSMFGGNGHEDCEPNCFYVFGDVLWLRARGADVPYAQPMDPTLTVPTGPVATSESHYSLGYRVGGGIGIGEDSQLQLTYTNWRSGSDDSVQAGANETLKALLAFPNTGVTTADVQVAVLRNDIDFQLADADFKRRFWKCGTGSASWMVGARYAQLHQRTAAEYVTNMGTTFVGSDIDFYGGGLRFGLEGEYGFGWGFFTFGRGAANFVAGHFGSTYQQNNTFSGIEATTGINENRIVPIFDLEAGLGWKTSGGRFRIMAGWYFSAWCNVLTTNSLIQGVQSGNFTTNGNNIRDTIYFDGLTLRVELRF